MRIQAPSIVVKKSKPVALLAAVFLLFATVWFVIPEAARADIETGLVGKWKLDEGTGTTTADISGNGNNGTLVRGTGTGSPAWVSPGHDGTGAALEFDGTGTQGAAANTVDVGNDAILDELDNYTISVWAKFEPGYVGNGGVWANLVGRTSPSADWAWMIYVNNQGRIRPHHKNSNGTFAPLTNSQTILPTGEWAHIEQVADNGNLYLYINGQLDPNFPISYSGTYSLPTGNVYIGQDTRENTPLATISEVSIYNKGRTAPGGVTGDLQLWMRGDSGVTGTSPVSSWADFSGNGNTGTASGDPSLSSGAVNFNDTISFDGVGDGFDTNLDIDPARYPDLAVFSVYKPATDPAGGVWGGDDGGWDRMYLQSSTPPCSGTSDGTGCVAVPDSFSTNAWDISSIIFDEDTANGSSAYVNGALKTSFTSDHGLSNNNFSIGQIGDDSSYFNGDIAEVVVYNQLLDSDDGRQRVESYLATRYGITLGDTSAPIDYLASDGTAFWTGSATYQNDVTGIGRDDTSPLDQRQSKSENSDALVTVGNGAIAADNDSNPNSFADNLSFMMWGNDGASADTTTHVDNTIFSRMERIWKVQETGTVDTVKLRIPQSALAGMSPTLLVSDDETFDDTDQQIALTVTGSNYEADVNFNDGQFYTFAVFGPDFGPGGVSEGLEYWIRPDDIVESGGVISQWDDVYQRHTDYTLVGPTAPSLGAGLNFNPTVTFNSGYLSFDEQLLAGATAGEIFSVLETHRPHTISGGFPFEFGGGGSAVTWQYDWSNGEILSGVGSTVRQQWDPRDAPAGGPSREIQDPHIFNILSKSGEWTARFDGVTNYTNTTNTPSFDSSPGNHTYIGAAHNARFSDADLSEVLAYRRELSATERQRVDTYLAIKYGLTLGTTAIPVDYIASDGTSTIWTGSTTYQNDIAGIGRDDTSLLNQKQSQSTNPTGIITIGHVTITADNASNPNNFDSDKTFMMWGNDAGSIDIVNDIIPVSGTQLKRMERIWDIQETGTVGVVKLQIPQAELSGTSPRLLVSNDEIFDDTDQLIALTASGANYEADVNFTGDQFFTFAVDMVAPEVTTDEATNITQTSATLHGTLDDLGDFAEADVFFRYRIVGSGDPFTETTPQTVSTAAPFSANISGLTLDTQYEFKTVIQWQNAGTQESEGSLQDFVTDPAVPPDAVLNLQAVSAGTSQIDLSWEPPVDEGGSPITGYQIERSPDGVSGWTTIVADTGNTDTTHEDTGLDPDTEYFYRISAINSAGTGDPSNIASATTDALAPPQTTTDAATEIAQTTATLNGALDTLGDFTPVDVFFRYRVQGSADPYTETIPQEMTVADPFSGNLTGLDPDTTYEFKTVVQWQDGGTQQQEGSLVTFTTLAKSGVPECTENFVDCFVNPVTGTNVVLEVDEACTINTAEMKSETDLNISDPGFEYPIGLMNFTLDCGTPGYTTTITQYYYDVTDNNYVLRKHNPNTSAYFTIEGASIEQTTQDGQTVTIATFQATDGGELDVDGEANGTIVDPVGLALSPDDGLSDTGQNMLIPAAIAGLFITASAGLIFRRKILNTTGR